MQTIVVANPKGGSGKTTLATNVAGWLAGKRRDVVLRDLDPQRSATEWLERRPSLFPPIGGLRREERATRSLSMTGASIDTPAGLHGEDLREAVRRADVMLVPLTPSAFDMGATRHFLTAIHEYKAIRKGELALGIIAMRVDPRTHSAAELDAFLEGLRFPGGRASARHPGVRPLRRDGASVFDLPRSRGEQDWEQWKPLTRWITRHASRKG
jgi:chromosome partitioning protein